LATNLLYTTHNPRSRTMATIETLVPADPKHYVWWFPGSPVKVHLDLQVVQRLKERLRSNGPGTSEEGLLFGRALDGAAEILDFQPASGSNVPNMIAALPNEQSRRSLMGYYRTEDGDTFHLNANDVSLAEGVFRKPYQVFLMIHSNGFGSPNATFFFHDGDRRMADFAFLEFPFDPSLLAVEERDRLLRSRDAAMEHSVEAPAASPAPESSTAVRPPNKSRVLLKAAGATCAIALIFALGTLVDNHSFRERAAKLFRAASTPATVNSSSSPAQSPSLPSMALHAERQNSDLQLTWNRGSALIANALSGVISIHDGESNRQIVLDSTQVRGGSLLYSPTSDQILLQLTVTTPAGTVTESVMVVLPMVGSPQTYILPAKSSSAPTAPPQPPLDSVPLARASRPFAAPSGSHDTPSPASPILTDSPPLKLNLDPAATLTPGFVLQTPLPQQPSPVTPSQPSASVIVRYQPAVAIAKAAPAFPPELRPFALKLKVIEVKVSIDKTGNVSKAEAIPQKNVNQFLVNSAVNAARLWRFQPAQRDNQPISSESVLQFVFGR
jgi:hypothetical protein